VAKQQHEEFLSVLCWHYAAPFGVLLIVGLFFLDLLRGRVGLLGSRLQDADRARRLPIPDSPANFRPASGADNFAEISFATLTLAYAFPAAFCSAAERAGTASGPIVQARAIRIFPSFLHDLFPVGVNKR
jgi:hypothetical protein